MRQDQRHSQKPLPEGDGAPAAAAAVQPRPIGSIHRLGRQVIAPKRNTVARYVVDPQEWSAGGGRRSHAVEKVRVLRKAEARQDAGLR